MDALNRQQSFWYVVLAMFTIMTTCTTSRYGAARAWTTTSARRFFSQSSISFSPLVSVDHNNKLKIRGGSRSIHGPVMRRLYSTTHVEPELLESLMKPKLELKTFGGLTYMDTHAPSFQDIFRVLFVLGGPGAGKGTQSVFLQENYPTVHLSVGELLRKEQTIEDSPYRKIIEQALVAGRIVPVQISLSLLEKAMQEKRQTAGEQLIYLVDGFPRNFENLNGWCDIMRDVTALWGVLFYQCPLPILEERIMKRAVDSGRSDDNLESLRKRFRTFEQETVPIVQTLGKASQTGTTQWSVMDIRGDLPLEEVWLATQSAMNKLILHDVVSANVALLDAVQASDVNRYQELCALEWFQGKDPVQVMKAQEGDSPVDASDAQLDVIAGKHVALSYNRLLDGQAVREKRVWVHQGRRGWCNVHFSRLPIA